MRGVSWQIALTCFVPRCSADNGNSAGEREDTFAIARSPSHTFIMVGGVTAVRPICQRQIFCACQLTLDQYNNFLRMDWSSIGAIAIDT